VKILVLGYNPPPLQAGTKLAAANDRSWQFVQPLLDDGHEMVRRDVAPYAIVARVPARPIGERSWELGYVLAYRKFLG